MVGLFGKSVKNETKKLIRDKKKQLKKLVKEKNYNKVLKTGSEILEKIPDDIDVLFIIGGVYYMQGKFTKAISCFDKVLSIGSYDTEALLLKANALVNLRKFAEAESCCNKIIEIDPKNKTVKELLQKISNLTKSQN